MAEAWEVADAGLESIPIFFLPGLGATDANILADDYPLASVRDRLQSYGKVTTLIHLPDIDCSSSICVDVEPVIRQLTTIIIEKCGGVSPIIAGYSIGGFIAFEICRRLEKAALAVRMLLMIDSSATYTPRVEEGLLTKIAKTADSGLASVFSRTPFLVAMNYRKLETARLWLVILRRLLGRSWGPDLRMTLLVAYWHTVIRTLQPAHYGGRIILFKAQKARPRTCNEALGWLPFASQIEVITVEGDHWSCVRQPDLLRSIAKLLDPLKIENRQS